MTSFPAGPIATPRHVGARDLALRFFLWWSVLGMALWVGGTVFHMLVVVPLWSGAPPESVRFFFGETEFNRTVYNFFGPPWMAARTLPLLVALALAWRRPPHRRALLVTVGCMAFAVVFTLAYVYPMNELLMTQAGRGVSDEEVRALVGRWITADRLRFVVGVVGFLALLRAFQLPVGARGSSGEAMTS